MKQLRRYLWAAVLLAWSSDLVAEQILVTKSGATLIGTVTFDSDAVLVGIADGELRVPMSEVVAIATIAGGHSNGGRLPADAQQLLMNALEARLLNDAGEEVLGILSQAARMAPDDPRIAFWYAWTLVDAGQGKAASEIFERHRAAITETYPGMADNLAVRIKERSELENLPPKLVDRIDKLNAAAAQQLVLADERQFFATFRVVDQNKTPIEQSAFRVECRGQDENIESFDEGYYLITFTRNRHTRDGPCTLTVTEPGFEPKTFEFSALTSQVKDAGEFAVTRYDEAAKRPFRLTVTDAQGKPIEGAKLRANSQSSGGRSSAESLATQTDAQGKAEILLYPGDYSYVVTADGFKVEQGNANVRSNDNATDRTVTLYPVLRSAVRVVWSSTSPQGAVEKTSGEVTLTIPPTPNYFQRSDAMHWMRPAQINEQLVLVLGDARYGGFPGAVENTWVRKMKLAQTPNETDERLRLAKEQFDALDLAKIDELKHEHPAAPESDVTSNRSTGPPGRYMLTAEFGSIYFGKIQVPDPRIGRTNEVAFKVLVEELETVEKDRK